MTAAVRWPLHPSPSPGEALSSWLQRIAYCYSIEVQDLGLDMGFLFGLSEELDTKPPPELAVKLEERTGVDADRIRKMSINGWVPWLLDDVQPDPEAFATYTRQLSVLLPDGRRKDRDVPRWRAWIPTKESLRACPRCASEIKPPYPYHLIWSLPLMLSCPVHHCLLEPHAGLPGLTFGWDSGAPSPQQANENILTMDRRTWHALTQGWVELPRRRVHAGLWFRLLRTIIDELSIPTSECGPAARVTRQVWDSIGRPVRAGQLVWHPHEEKPLTVQIHTLEAAATAIALLESKTITGRGTDAALFRPAPITPIEDMQPPLSPVEPVNYWQKLAKSMDEAVEDARHNPDGARQLFKFLTWYRTDADSLQEICNLFADLDIPLSFPSH